MQTYPNAELNVLATRHHELPQRDRDFAVSLLDQYARRGDLSPKQWPWVAKLAERLTAPPAPKAPATETVGDLSGVLALFDRAKCHLKFPAVELSDGKGLHLRVNLAGEKARVPGSLTVVTASDCWLGRVTREGTFEKSGKFADLATAAGDLLRRFAADPAGVAAEHGRLTGDCSFCARPLKDERSTSVGYGPVCADRWELPWGDRPSKARKAKGRAQ